MVMSINNMHRVSGRKGARWGDAGSTRGAADDAGHLSLSVRLQRSWRVVMRASLVTGAPRRAPTEPGHPPRVDVRRAPPIGEPEAVAPIDSSLVRRAQAREAEAIAELLRRSRPLVERTVGRLCHDRELAEDLVQTCLLIVLTRLPGLRTPEAFVGWAQSIARNVCRKELDRQARRRAAMARVMWHPPDLSSGDVGVVDPEELALRSEVRLHLDRALGALPDRYRKVVTLRALYGYTYDEIGQLLHAPGELVRLWHFRGRHHLQALCGNDEVLVRAVSTRAKLAPAPTPR